jgi:LacI family transcriptional regulator/LacI family purine nucleotide synthesis repressor
MEPAMKVGVRDISRKTGFSPATVSNALNRKRGVSKQTAEIILKAARDMGYQRQGHLNRIQFVIARKSGRIIDESAFHPVVITGIEREAKRHNLPTTYVTVNLPDPSAKNQIREMCSDPTGAIILLGTEMWEKDYQPFYDSVAPFVIVDGWCSHRFMDSIVISNETSAYRAVNYLISKGHKKIGYLHGNPQIRNFPLRYRGFKTAMREATLPIDERFQTSLGTTLSTALADMDAWLNDGPELPTAFFADNDVLAVGAMQALAKHNIHVPEEVSLIGFDDLSFASISSPPLTTICVPKQAIGELAVRRVIEQTQGNTDYTCVTHVSTTFIERDSVAEYQQR